MNGEKETTVATVAVKSPELRLGSDRANKTPNGTETDTKKPRRWLRRSLAIVAGVSLTGVAVRYNPWVQQERRESRAAEIELERVDAKFIAEEHAGTRDINNLADVVILRAGVEVRYNCDTLNSTFLVKPSNNKALTIPPGKIMSVAGPVRIDHNDGTFWYRFSTGTINKDAKPNTTATFSEDQVAAKNVCVDVEKYAGKTNVNGDPYIDYKFTDEGANLAFVKGAMDNAGVIRVGDTVVAVGALMDERGEGFLDSYEGVLRMQMRENGSS